MAEDNVSGHSDVWIDIAENSPSNSLKQLTEHLPSPRIPENITQQSQSYNNHDSNVPPGLPHIRSPRYEIDEVNEVNEIKERILPITPYEMPQTYPKLVIDSYQSTDTITTAITCNTSRRSSEHDSFPDIDVVNINNIVDTVITACSTNPQHSQQTPAPNNSNSNGSNESNDSKDSNNDSISGPNHNQNNNDNNGHRKNRNINNDTKEEHKCINETDYTYFPHKIYKNMMNGSIRITKLFTGQIIPKGVKQKHIRNVYDFLCKIIAINVRDKNIFYCANVLILNCGFHEQDTFGQDLYCVADKSNHKNYSYVMRDKLYTGNEIASLLAKHHRYGSLPVASTIVTNDFKKICNEFDNAASVCQNIIFNTKWHRVHVFNIPNKNKQRLTFSITKNEFIDIVQRYIHTGNNKELLPIVMFSKTYRVEYVQIVPLRKNIYIGISYIYDKSKNCIKVTGIHINKNSILLQHQLVDIEHNCNCLNGFISEIDCLHIGNADDTLNKYKDLKKKYKQLQDNNANTNNENNQSKIDNNTLQLLCHQQTTNMNVMQAEITLLKQQQQQMLMYIQQQQVTQIISPIVVGSTPIPYTHPTMSTITPNSVLSSTFSPTLAMQNINSNSSNRTNFTNPRHSMQNSNSSNFTNITSPSVGTPHSAPQLSNMTYSNPINTINNVNQTPIVVNNQQQPPNDKKNSNKNKKQNPPRNEKNSSKNKKEKSSDFNNDGDNANQ